jgi:hypothetical protein
LAEWHRVFTSAFAVFETIAEYLLAGELRLTTSQDPAGKVAVCPEAPRPDHGGRAAKRPPAQQVALQLPVLPSF